MRELSPDDMALWRHVTRNVDPYRPVREPRHGTPDEPRDDPKEKPTPRAPEPVRRPPVRDPAPLAVGDAAHMDHRMARRFKRGDLPLDARIDLHGLTLAEAHAALTGFIRNTQARGSRCVVVVTGKGSHPTQGNGASESKGKIRRELPHWLNQPQLRSLVLAVTEARNRDGGTGAFYVLLRRRR